MKIVPNFLTSDQVEALIWLAGENVFSPGRQETGYDKTPVPKDLFINLKNRSLEALGLTANSSYDCYIVRYIEGAFIPPHLDDAPLATQHHRINALIQRANKGGELFINNEAVSLALGDAYIFRPDTEIHEVYPVIKGTRLIWTLGALQ